MMSVCISLRRYCLPYIFLFKSLYFLFTKKKRKKIHVYLNVNFLQLFCIERDVFCACFIGEQNFA